MKVIYEKQKGGRIKKGSIKIAEDNINKRVDNFIGLIHHARLNEDVLHWNIKLNKWIKSDCDEYWENAGNNRYYNTKIKSVKSAIRHINKQDEILEGTKFILESNFQGYDVIIIK